MILFHNESSHLPTWPLRQFFSCILPSETGGETPLADVRRVLGRISPETRERFRERKVMYVRNYDEGLGLDWREVFQTEDRAAVERYCAAAGITAEWGEGDRLRTRQVAQAVARHPQTGEEVWFNHAAFFHVSRLDARVREALLEAVGEEHLPNNSFYGDGGAIEPSALEEVAAAYDAETVAFPWQAGDILMLDNMLVAHGRRPYTGARKILVAMTEPFARAAL
jgi:alpha-ketoglutarate-dependent taurine dioxygenase